MNSEKLNKDNKEDYKKLIPNKITPQKLLFLYRNGLISLDNPTTRKIIVSSNGELKEINKQEFEKKCIDLNNKIRCIVLDFWKKGYYLKLNVFGSIIQFLEFIIQSSFLELSDTFLKKCNEKTLQKLEENYINTLARIRLMNKKLKSNDTEKVRKFLTILMLNLYTFYKSSKNKILSKDRLIKEINIAFENK